MNQHDDIRLSLPSKGRLSERAIDFLAACGFDIYKPNPRQYAASIPTLPGVTVLFQRVGDIVVGVRDGTVDFGITGMDVTAEHRGAGDEVLVLHDKLGFGSCHLAVAVPEAWERVTSMDDLAAYTNRLDRALRVATKFPNVTRAFLTEQGIAPFTVIEAEGTLEVAPAIGYADCIVDLVSSGQTLRDNRLRELAGGTIFRSQAALIANRAALQTRPEVLDVARTLLEFTEAHLRAQSHVLVTANMRGDSPDAIAADMAERPTLRGLQGPTVSPVIAHGTTQNGWYAVQIAARRGQLFDIIRDLRTIGGSGVVVTPITYVFEEEPERYKAMMEAVKS